MDLHLKQKYFWEKEHKTPRALLAIDAIDVSNGVEVFWDWVKGKLKSKNPKGLEMCCGKGRNCFFLASKGVEMFGYDFSSNATAEANHRAKVGGFENVHFITHDAEKKLPYKNNLFDFVVDCFGSTDISSLEVRRYAKKELLRVLKPGGYYLVYTLSTSGQFHYEVSRASVLEEKNAYIIPEIEKFEKAFDEEELLNFYQDLKILEKRKLTKRGPFLDKEYEFHNFWLVLQKP